MELTITNIFLLGVMYALVGLGMVHALIAAHNRYDIANPKTYVVGATIWPFILIIAFVMTVNKLLNGGRF